METSNAYLTAPQVRERYNISDMSLHRWLHNADLNFPQPMIVNRRRYFRLDELVSWERGLIETSETN